MFVKRRSSGLSRPREVTMKRPTRADIRAKFEAGEISWEEVFRQIALAPKPWESAEWKRRRAEVLKDKCETCGTSAPPLYVQHHWHPSTFAELCDVAKEILRDEFKRSHPYDPPVLSPFDPSLAPPQERTERDCCPRCDSVNIRFYKTFAKWHCNARRCGAYFESPGRRMYQRFDEDEWVERSRYRHARPLREHDKQWQRNFVQSCHEQICSVATELSFLEHDRYVEMRPEDVRTLCKKCAFREDADYSKGWIAKEWAKSQERLRQIMKSLEAKTLHK